MEAKVRNQMKKKKNYYQTLSIFVMSISKAFVSEFFKPKEFINSMITSMIYYIILRE